MSASTPRMRDARRAACRRAAAAMLMAAAPRRAAIPARAAPATWPAPPAPSSTVVAHRQHRAVLGLQQAVRHRAVDLREEAVEVAFEVDERPAASRGCRAGPTSPFRTTRRRCRSRRAARRTRRRASPSAPCARASWRRRGARSSPEWPTSRTISCSVMTPIDPAARIERGLRGDLHQPDAAAAVDQRHAARRQRAAELRRGFGIGRPRADVRAAEQADAGDLASWRTRGCTARSQYAATASRCACVIGRPHLVRRHSTSSARARPLLGDQVVDFARGESRAEILSQVGHRLRFAENAQRARAVATAPARAAASAGSSG